MIGRLCRFRQANLDCLAYGELLDELRPAGELERTRVTWHGRWQRNAPDVETTLPVVIGSLWRDGATGRNVLFAVNLTDREQRLVVANAGFAGRELTLGPREIRRVGAE